MFLIFINKRKINSQYIKIRVSRRSKIHYTIGYFRNFKICKITFIYTNNLLFCSSFFFIIMFITYTTCFFHNLYLYFLYTNRIKNHHSTGKQHIFFYQHTKKLSFFENLPKVLVFTIQKNVHFKKIYKFNLYLNFLTSINSLLMYNRSSSNSTLHDLFCLWRVYIPHQQS